jgi:exosortase
MRNKNVFFTIFGLMVYAVFYAHFRGALNGALPIEYYSHSTAIPLIVAFLLFLKMTSHEMPQVYYSKTGLAVIAFGIFLYLFFRHASSQMHAYASLCLLTVTSIACWTGGYIFCYGVQNLRIAAVPLSFLLFMIPIPLPIVEKIVLLLQGGSSLAAEGFFRLFMMPYTRDGFIFHLQTLSVEVAKQCSGIHSTLALVITGALAAYLFLQNSWKRLILVLSVIPITVVKNGLRIAVLSMLGVYQSEQILVDGWLHRSGGVVFFIVAVLLLWGVLWSLTMLGGNGIVRHGDK